MAGGRKGVSIKEKLQLSPRYLLLGLSIFCVLLIVLSFNIRSVAGPFRGVANYLIVPLQKGVSAVGEAIVERNEQKLALEELKEENATLREELALLNEELVRLQKEEYELMELRRLFNIDETYAEYEKVGARIIAKDNSNWYHTFLINKGTNDGLEVDMNVLAGGGLVGRITAVGSDWARVSSLIDDNANVSGTVLSTGDNLMVSGDLKLYEKGTIAFGHLQDSKNRCRVGDKVVTSNISDKYLPGLLIGYLSEVHLDTNNLTKSGELIPAVDFAHLDSVLVILGKKKIPAGT